MYSSCGTLGEVVPAGSPLYSAHDAPAASLVALITTDWDRFKGGIEFSREFDKFQEAVKFGWVPDTPEGFDRLYGLPTTAATLNAYPELLAWSLAWTTATVVAEGGYPVDKVPAFWENQLQNWIRQGMTPASADVADAAFRRYFAGYLIRFKGPATPAIAPRGDYITNPVTGAAMLVSDILYGGPLPGAPAVSIIETKAGKRWTWDAAWTGPVIGAPGPLTQQLVDYYAARAAPAVGAPRTLVSRTFDALLIHPTVDPARYFAVTDPTLYSPKYQRVHEHFSDNTDTVSPWAYAGAGGWETLAQWRSAGAWGTDNYGPLWPDRVNLRLWESLSASDRAAVNAELAAGPVPPAPPQIATETAAQGAQYQSPATAAPTTSAAAPATAPAPGGTAGATPAPSQAAGVGSGGLLIGGGILAAVLLLGSRKGRRPSTRGYRRY